MQQAGEGSESRGPWQTFLYRADSRNNRCPILKQSSSSSGSTIKYKALIASLNFITSTANPLSFSNNKSINRNHGATQVVDFIHLSFYARLPEENQSLPKPCQRARSGQGQSRITRLGLQLSPICRARRHPPRGSRRIRQAKFEHDTL